MHRMLLIPAFGAVVSFQVVIYCLKPNEMPTKNSMISLSANQAFCAC